MKSVRSNLILRAAAILVMALALGGPTPGRISGCGSEAGSVDAVAYCIQFETYVCARDLAAGRIDEAGHDRCREQILSTCENTSFPIGCLVTSQAANLCIDALANPATLDVVATRANPGFPECYVCGGAGGGIDPEGI